MPQINAGDFRKGVKVIIEGEPYNMLELNFVKPGKGQALYKTRLKHLFKGTILDRTYKSGDSLEGADVRQGEGQFTYRDGDNLVFMDNETYEQYPLALDACGDAAQYLQEGMTCGLLYWNEQLIDITAPPHVILEVTYTEPAARGNTASSLTKPATVETGATITVPAFVETGEKIKIDTRTGDYIERARD